VSIDLYTVNPLTDPEWDTRIMKYPEYSVFHSQAWARVLFESYGFITVCFLRDKKGSSGSVVLPMAVVQGFLGGKRGVSLPFSDYCDPLLDEGVEVKSVLDSLSEFGSREGWKQIEIRGRSLELPGEQESAKYFGHVFDLTGDEEGMYRKFRDSTRRNIQTARRQGVEVRISQDWESISDFYRLNCITRRTHGLPPQPLRFFRKLHEHILSKGKGFIANAYHRRKPVAGNVYLHIGDRAYYKYGASDPFQQAVRPSNLVMWEAIQWFGKNGFKTLCFGKTEQENEGLRRYKLSWGTRESMITYYKYDMSGRQYVKGKDMIRGPHNGIFKRMPLPLLRIIGRVAYRYFA
jgi:hypothetical protein